MGGIINCKGWSIGTSWHQGTKKGLDKNIICEYLVGLEPRSPEGDVLSTRNGMNLIHQKVISVQKFYVLFLVRVMKKKVKMYIFTSTGICPKSDFQALQIVVLDGIHVPGSNGIVWVGAMRDSGASKVDGLQFLAVQVDAVGQNCLLS